ncbi:MAG: hypothetical protein Q8N77_00940 [Nanoarchaeota archaeon]|nr:hypothetical protein [Nanoarchaeota archaeon]
MLKIKYDRSTIEKILNESDRTDIIHIKMGRSTFPFINEQREGYCLLTNNGIKITSVKSKKYLWRFSKENYTLCFTSNSEHEEIKDKIFAKEMYEKFKTHFA